MEEVIYYATIAAVIAFGLVAGNRWARSRSEAVLIGLGGTTIAVVTFLCLIVAISIFSPDSLDSREIGVRLGALMIFGSALGVVSAVGGTPRKPPPGCINRRNTLFNRDNGAPIASAEALAL